MLYFVIRDLTNKLLMHNDELEQITRTYFVLLRNTRSFVGNRGSIQSVGRNQVIVKSPVPVIL